MGADSVLLIVTTSVSILSFIFGVGGLSLALYLYTEVKALKNSTHSIQYVPVDEPTLAVDKGQVVTDEQIVTNDVKKGGKAMPSTISNDPFDNNEVIL